MEKGGLEAGKSVAQRPCSLSHKPVKAWVPLAFIAPFAQHPCFLSSTCSSSLSVSPFGIFWGLCVPFLTLQAPHPISTHRQRTATPTYFRTGPSVSASSLFLPSLAIGISLQVLVRGSTWTLPFLSPLPGHTLAVGHVKGGNFSSKPTFASVICFLV